METKVLAVKTKDYRNIDNNIWVFDPDITIVSGKNDAGKTNLLSTIANAIGKTDFVNIIRDNKEEAEIELSIGNAGDEKIKITAKFKPGKPRKITITTKNGLPVEKDNDNRTKGELLKELWNNFTIDMNDIKSRSDTDLVKFIIQHSDIEQEYNELEKHYNDAYNSRRTIGQLLKSKEKELGEEVEEVEYVNIDELVKEYSDLEAKCDEYDEAVANMDRLATEVGRIEEEIKRWQEKLNTANALYDAAIEYLSTIYDPSEEFKEVKQKYMTASDKNAKYNQYINYIEKNEEINKLRTKYSEYDDIVKSIPEKRLKLINRMGIDNLSVDDDANVIYNNRKIADLAENKRYLLLIQLKMIDITKDEVVIDLLDGTKVSRIKTLVIENGSALDHDTRNEVYKMAKEYGVQVILEKPTNKVYKDGKWVWDTESDKQEAYNIYLEGE